MRDCLHCRIISFFSDKSKIKDSDDIHAALALMYGYAARYAPSTVIEARIDALVVKISLKLEVLGFICIF